jgi:hypothetical protein
MLFNNRRLLSAFDLLRSFHFLPFWCEMQMVEIRCGAKNEVQLREREAKVCSLICSEINL